MINARVDTRRLSALLTAAALAPAAVQRRVQEVVDRYAEIIAREAKGLAPVDSGTLRASIRYELYELAARVLAATPYAAAVELGRTDNPNYPVQPFLAPALEIHRTAFERDLESALGVAVREVAT